MTVTVIAKNGFTGSTGIQLEACRQEWRLHPLHRFPLPRARAKPSPSAFRLQRLLQPRRSASLATSGAVSHKGNIGLTILPTPLIKTFDTETVLVLETDTPTETTRVGLLKSWGGIHS